MLNFILILLSFIATGCSIKFLPAPYFWSGLVWSLVFLILSIKEKKSILRIVFLNTLAAILVLTCAELYFWSPTANKITAQGNMWTPEQYVRNDVFGYAPPKGVNNVIGKKYYDNKIIYDMSFSTNDNGQRKSFPVNSDAHDAVIFFGCSITFGDGVNDNQTVPYQVGLRNNGKINAYNFAYSGYGAHQMLSAIEHGLIEQYVAQAPKYAIYTAIPGHILRSAGLQTWPVTAHDPKYDLDEKGKVHFAGHYDDHNKDVVSLTTRIRAHLSNSYILKKVYKPFTFNQKRLQNQDDFDKYIKIVVKSRDTFEKKFPGSEFHVILWNLNDSMNNEQVLNQVLSEFKNNNIRVHQIKDILPGFYQNHPHYQIAFDSHPTPYANEIIAQYITQNIIHE